MSAAHDPEDLQARGLDPVAVRAVLRRLRRASQPAWLHAEVARRMAEKLEVILFQPDRVLDWWGGVGGGTAVLAQTYPKALITQVEPDAEWVQRAGLAARRSWWHPGAWGAPRVRAVAEAEPIEPGAGLIWANMMLHGVVDPTALFERWHGLLRVDGFVMFSCLGPGTLRELRSLYDTLGWPAPTPAFVDMHDLGDMLVHAGFADPVMDQETLTLRWASPGALLAELRGLGGNAAPRRHAGLCTPRWRERLEAALQSRADADGSIGLSFEVAYGHAFKAAPRQRAGQATTVSLQDMRAMVRAGPPGGKKPRGLR